MNTYLEDRIVHTGLYFFWELIASISKFLQCAKSKHLTVCRTQTLCTFLWRDKWLCSGRRSFFHIL